jgi:hypothetical protein
MSDLERTKVITIKGQTFVYDITRFRVADYLAMEVEKQRLTNSNYFAISTTYFVNTLNAANIIDMIATFRILFPEVEKCLGTTYELLNIFDIKELLSVYVKEIAPWFKTWMDEFNQPLEMDGKAEDKV